MTARPGSRLPNEPEYWDGLAERVTEAAEPVLSRLGDTRSGADGRVRRWRAPALAAAAAVLAVLGTWIGTDPPSELQAAESVSPIEAALQPQDPLAVVLLSDASAPAIEELLRALPPRTPNRNGPGR